MITRFAFAPPAVACGPITCLVKDHYLRTKVGILFPKNFDLFLKSVDLLLLRIS